MLVKGKHYRAVWMKGRAVHMIDQRLLPFEFKILKCPTSRHTAAAIKNMTVRGAGSIGAAAGFAAGQAVIEARGQVRGKSFERALSAIRQTRPTARDLFAAVERVAAAARAAASPKAAIARAVAEAEAVASGYTAATEKIGRFGLRLLRRGARVMTHCNAGWLALEDGGSALAPLYAAKRAGKKVFVYVSETRPRLQGAQLTAWELSQEKIDFAIIADGASGHFLKEGGVDLVIVGADRIARNGDVANKIGTYDKAVLARENKVPFYVAAPLSTIDLDCPSGKHIPIEERDEREVLEVRGRTREGRSVTVRVAPKGARAQNPAFDVTPARYIRGIITELGILKPGQLARLKNRR